MAEANYKKLTTIFLMAIVFTVPLIVYKGTYPPVLIKISLTQFFLLLILLVWGYFVITRTMPGCLIKKSPLDLPLFIFVLASLISLFFSPYRWAGIAAVSLLLTYLLLYIVSFNVARDEANRYRIIAVWILSAALVSLIGLYQYFFRGARPVLSTFGNANFFAAFLVISLPLTLSVLLETIFHKNKLRVVCLTVLLPVMLFNLFLTGSRGGWLGLAVGLTSWIWLCRIKFFSGSVIIRRLIPIFLITIILLTVCLSPWLLEKDFIKEDLTRGTMGIRLLIWEGTVRMIAARPFLGWGPGSFQLAYPPYRLPEYFANPHAVDATAHAHNEFLEVAAEGGFLSLGVFIWMLVIFFTKGINTVKNEGKEKTTLTIGLISGVAGLLAANLVGVNLRFASSAIFFWLALGLVMGQDRGSGYWLRVTGYRLRILKWAGSGLILVIIIWSSLQVVAKPFLSAKYFQNGVNARKGENWNEAILNYEKAIELDPHFIKAYYRLGFAYAAINNKEKAIAAYEQVINLVSDFASVQANVAFLYKETGQLNKAVKAYQRALKLNPYNLEAVRGLEIIYGGNN